MIPLPQRLTLRDDAGFAAALGDLSRAVADTSGEQVVIDASLLTELDSAAVALLLALRREAQLLGKRFMLHKPSHRLCELARLYGVADLIAVPQT